MTCCSHFLSRSTAPSPFSAVLITDYYDGPVSGVAVCRECSQPYRFTLLARSGSDSRVYSFAPLPTVVYHEIIEMLSKYEEPRWPRWFPSNTSTTEDDMERAFEAVDAILQRNAGAPCLVIVSDDGLESITKAMSMSVEDVRDVVDWFEFLGIQGQPYPVP